jgi:hypothetical protein
MRDYSNITLWANHYCWQIKYSYFLVQVLLGLFVKWRMLQAQSWFHTVGLLYFIQKILYRPLHCCRRRELLWILELHFLATRQILPALVGPTHRRRMKLKIGTANVLRIVLGRRHQTILLATLLSDCILVQKSINSIL